MDSDKSKRRRYDVIIVGGGMAGLSAAESLLATSGGRVGKLLLLEAGQRLAINSGDTLFIVWYLRISKNNQRANLGTNSLLSIVQASCSLDFFRWGGRTHSLRVEDGGKLVEMGANWIHGGRSLTCSLFF